MPDCAACTRGGPPQTPAGSSNQNGIPTSTLSSPSFEPPLPRAKKCSQPPASKQSSKTRAGVLMMHAAGPHDRNSCRLSSPSTSYPPSLHPNHWSSPTAKPKPEKMVIAAPKLCASWSARTGRPASRTASDSLHCACCLAGSPPDYRSATTPIRRSDPMNNRPHTHTWPIGSLGSNTSVAHALPGRVTQGPSDPRSIDF